MCLELLGAILRWVRPIVLGDFLFCNVTNTRLKIKLASNFMRLSEVYSLIL